MTPKQQAQKELAIQKLEELYSKERENFECFFKTMRDWEYDDKLIRNRHMEEMCYRLQKVAEWKTQRLIINTCPRSWKTEMILKLFALRMMGRNNSKIMSLSASLWLVQRSSQWARDLFNSKTYKMIFPRVWGIKKDQDTKTYWKIDAWAEYYSAWFDGTITGIGANLILVDDPMKAQDLSSPVILDKTINIYNQTIRSRLNKNKQGAIVIIMQRLHERDLIGHILEQEKKWVEDEREKLIIPAIIDWENWQESFFPEMFPMEKLMKEKGIDAANFACQYLQSPSSETRSEFKREWFKYYKTNPVGMRIFVTIDPAFTKNKSSDQTSIMVWWFVGDNHYILEYSTGKRDINELMQECINMIGKYRPEKVGIETVGWQIVLKTTLEDLLQKNKLYTIVEGINSHSNKEVKIRSLLVKYWNWLIRHRIEHLELEKQLLEFPKWAHDDIVDSLAMQYEIHRPIESTTSMGMWLQTSQDERGNTIYH